MIASLRGLPRFLRFLGALPPPEPVLNALRSGPLTSLGPRAGMMWHVRDTREMVTLASFGHTREAVDRYSTLPLTLKVPAVDCVHEKRVLIRSADTFPRTALATVDSDYLGRLMERLEIVTLIDLPITHAGDVVGVIGMMCDQDWDDTHASRGLLDAVSCALGLWMTHPLVGIDALPGPSAQSRERALTLTDRQVEVMLMVAHGMGNADIARRLLVSESTVKQEVQHVMRTVRADDRLTAVDRARLLGLL